MQDETETIRRSMVQEINAEPKGIREQLESQYGQVWDTTQMQEEFEALGFLAPFIVVRRRSDGQRGSLMFQHQPRFYFQYAKE